MAKLNGVTRDSTGAALGGVTVKAFDADTDILAATGVSDASGNYSLTVGDTGPFYVVAYVEGTNFLAGTTRRDLAAIADPVTATVHSLWTGTPTTDGAVISAKLLTAATSTRIAVSTSSTLSNPTYTAAVAPDATYRFAKHRITGKAANTEYWYAVEVDGVIDPATKGRFKTLPAAGPASFSIALGGCAENTNDAAFVAIAAINPRPLMMLTIGDHQYMDNANPGLAHYNNAFDATFARAGRAQVARELPNIYMWDDHDIGADNSTGRTSTGVVNGFRAAALSFYRSRVPALPVSAVATETVHQSFVVGRVRFVVSDLRSDKWQAAATDDANKTMMGAAQKQWWKDEITAAKAAGQVVAWVNGTPWVTTSAVSDAWGQYATERTELADHIKAAGMSGKVFILSADMHAMAIHSGVDYATGGGAITPVFQAGPLNRTVSHKGGPYTIGPFPAVGTGVATQYGIMDIADDGTTLTITWRGFNQSGAIAGMTYSFTPIAPAAATAPSKMAKPTAVAGVNSAAVTLAAPYDGGSPITGYTVTSIPAGGVDAAAGTLSLQRTITGLTAGVSYTFTATATNAKGTSPASDPSTAVVPTAPPVTVFEATGGTITTPGDGYKYWTFLASDTLNVTTPGEVDYLVVAGGGGGSRGSSSTGGGGGAGGLRTGKTTIAAGAQAITVGAGGVGSTTGYGANGGDSSIAALVVATGGGAGGHSAGTNPGKAGGSGGGGGSFNSSTKTEALPGTGIAGQGHDGGHGYTGDTNPLIERAAGGGGGAGTAGGNSSLTLVGGVNEGVGGNGGDGVTVWGRLLAGGGGGASAGSTQGVGKAGGTNGVNASVAANATPNTGSGGGGAHGTATSGAGGSGIVVIRRAV